MKIATIRHGGSRDWSCQLRLGIAGTVFLLTQGHHGASIRHLHDRPARRDLRHTGCRTTKNSYAWGRAERVAEQVLSGEHVATTHTLVLEAPMKNAKLPTCNSLALSECTGDGGNRTPSSAMRPRRVPVTPRPQSTCDSTPSGWEDKTLEPTICYLRPAAGRR
jgi:hypothetical protein